MHMITGSLVSLQEAPAIGFDLRALWDFLLGSPIVMGTLILAVALVALAVLGRKRSSTQ